MMGCREQGGKPLLNCETVARSRLHSDASFCWPPCFVWRRCQQAGSGLGGGGGERVFVLQGCASARPDLASAMKDSLIRARGSRGGRRRWRDWALGCCNVCGPCLCTWLQPELMDFHSRGLSNGAARPGNWRRVGAGSRRRHHQPLCRAGSAQGNGSGCMRGVRVGLRCGGCEHAD